MTLVEWVFWTSAVLVGYAYLGYPAIVWVLARLFPRPVRKAPLTPTITILMAAHNEQERISEKIENCLALDYPPSLLDLTIVSDGSSDKTAAIVEEYAARYPSRVKLISIPIRNGKANALNVGAAQAKGEILLLTDVRQRFERQAVLALAPNFADKEVGAVSGELILLEEGTANHQKGIGLYWRFEKTIRQAESRCGSTIGYTGAISAIRRSLFTRLPKDALLDDLVMPLRVVAKGYRVIFEAGARVVDWVPKASRREFSRKVRTLAGVLQTLVRLKEFVGPLGIQEWWQFVSHKLLRLVVPYALVTALVASTFLEGPLYRATLVAQIITYGLGMVGLVSNGRAGRRRVVSVPYTLLMLNFAAVIGTFCYLSGQRLDLWQVPSEEGGDA